MTEQEHAQIRTFIFELPERARAHEDALRRHQGTAKLVLGEAGVFRATLQEGQVEVLEGEGPADVTAHMKPEDFLKAMRGRLNWVLALTMGRIKLTGDVSLLMRLREVFGK
ncbi:MAG: SCP2 sterol-binding domain-containing protein [Gaiellales bacterium]|nr:SCP2 sterol-binding domain-containing protein [Gaiellales bacterium]